MASSTNGDITGVLASLTEEELALLALLTKEELASLTEEQLKSFFESVPSQPKIGKSIPLPEAISSFYKDEKERYDLLSYISGYLSFVYINDTGVCSPNILLYLSRIYSTIIVIIHYEDTVGEPTIVNGVLDGTAFEDICFILCKGGHCYGMYVPNKGIRKDIYFDIIGNFNYQCIKFDS